MARLICGVGINDAGYTVLETANVDGKPKIVWRCPFYVTWSSMMQRCYNKKHQTDNRPTYIGCTVIEKWHVFSVFKKWMETQDWEGNALDKDILFYGNKIYSPKTCVFVNQMTNSFFAHNNTEKRRSGYVQAE